MRRLNRKVAFIGFAVIAFLLLGVIAVILHLGQDPKEFIRDAEVAIEAARKATDEQTKEENYKKAGRSFRNAYDRAKTDTLREEILLSMLDMYVETNEWNFILGCWEGLIKVNPSNARARYGRLEYLYTLADSGDQRYWPQVQEQASEFLKVAEDAGLLAEERAGLRISAMEPQAIGLRQLGSYLYLLRGRAAFEMARLGAVIDKDESLDKAVADLNKVRELEPDSIDAYLYLARVAVTRGDIFASRGNFEERDKATQQAETLLEQAIDVAGDSPRAYINLLSLKLALAGGRSPEAMKERIRSVEPEYLSLVDKFSSSAEAFAAASDFYRVYSIYSGTLLGSEKLNKAIETSERAISLDKENVPYAIDLGNLHYRRFSVYEKKPDIGKAIEIATATLALPGAQDTPGPRRLVNRKNRYNLFTLLANCYLDQILEAGETGDDAEIQAWLSGAEEAVHELEQLVGSGEDPRLVAWQGMLELARGNKQAAVVKLYTAYGQLRAVKPPEPPWPPDPEFAQISYALASIFKDTSEVGAVREFLASALISRIDWTKPQASLDYVVVLLKYGHFSDALENLDAFEGRSGSNPRSLELRIKAHIGAKQFDEAERLLSARPQNEPETIELRLALTQARIRHAQLAEAQKRMEAAPGVAPEPITTGVAAPIQPQADLGRLMTDELRSLTQLEAELMEQLLPTDLDYAEQSAIMSACRSYIAQGQTELAGRLLTRFREYYPDNTASLVYSKILAEPDPRDVSDQRLREIEEQALLQIADTVRRAVQFGIHHRRYGEPEKATVYLKQALETVTAQEPESEQVTLAANHLLDIAIAAKDWQLAEEVVKAARQGDLDDCRGQVFATRLAVARGEYKDALSRIDECLKQKPIFSFGYMLRSKINAALGNEHASMEDIQQAASLNPLDGTIAKASASLLYSRNQRLGANLSPAQIAETREALERAVSLNPRDLPLLGLYADYIASAEPLRAVAIRQDLQKAQPSVENAVMLGRLATQVALEKTAQESRDALFDVAETAFEQARQINPGDRQMLYYYAEYLRARGRGERAKTLLQESQDKQLLWNHYFQAGQYEDAAIVLEQLYKSGDKDSSVLRGLLLVSEKTLNKEAIKKYSEELIKVEDTPENNLAQIGTFLRVGLVKEAERELQSFKEKYPDEPRILLLRAWLLMRRGQLEEALELTNRNLQDDPDNFLAWRLKGEINFFRGDYDQAISDLRKSKVLFDEPATRVSLAKAYLQMKRYEDATTELKITIDAPGAPLEARSLLEHIYFKLGRKQALTKFYEKTLEKFPQSARWLNQAGAFAIKTEEFDKAERFYGKALDTRRQLHDDTGKAGDIQDALYAAAFDGYLKALIAGAGTPSAAGWDPGKLGRVFEEAARYQETTLAPMAYFRMAQAKSILGDKAAAIEYSGRAVDAAGANETLASEVLQKMYLLLGYEEVLKYCRQKLQSDPESLVANFTMSYLARINGEYDKAIEYIDRCIQLTGPDSPRRMAYALKKGDILLLAYTESSDKNYLKMAIADYESLLAKMPNNIGVATVLNNLAYVLAENDERLSDALGYAKRAFDAKPNDPGVLDTYAYVLLKNGKTAQAEESLAAALQQYEQDKITVPAPVYEHKGMIKEKLGAKAEALAAYKRALEIGGETLLPKARQRIEKAIERVSP
ncbi:MAG: tetratricopeptide repeat protein [Planctomycetota bacterium]